MLVNKKYPPQNIEKWEELEVSHRCIEILPKHDSPNYVWRCIDINCLNWESKGYNQGRANPICRITCKHKGCNSQLTACICNEYHDPPCW